MTTTAADFARMSDQNLVDNYWDVSRERCTTEYDAAIQLLEMSAMHAELVRRDIDWEDPRWFAQAGRS